jgi:zinc transporter ZupT
MAKIKPVGAVIGYLILAPYLSDLVLGVIFAMVAGVMVFLAIDTLLTRIVKSFEEHLILVLGCELHVQKAKRFLCRCVV